MDNSSRHTEPIRIQTIILLYTMALLYLINLSRHSTEAKQNSLCLYSAENSGKPGTRFSYLMSDEREGETEEGREGEKG